MESTHTLQQEKNVEKANLIVLPTDSNILIEDIISLLKSSFKFYVEASLDFQKIKNSHHIEKEEVTLDKIRSFIEEVFAHKTSGFNCVIAGDMAKNAAAIKVSDIILNQIDETLLNCKDTLIKMLKAIKNEEIPDLARLATVMMSVKAYLICVEVAQENKKSKETPVRELIGKEFITLLNTLKSKIDEREIAFLTTFNLCFCMKKSQQKYNPGLTSRFTNARQNDVDTSVIIGITIGNCVREFYSRIDNIKKKLTSKLSIGIKTKIENAVNTCYSVIYNLNKSIDKFTDDFSDAICKTSYTEDVMLKYSHIFLNDIYSQLQVIDQQIANINHTLELEKQHDELVCQIEKEKKKNKKQHTKLQHLYGSVINHCEQINEQFAKQLSKDDKRITVSTKNKLEEINTKLPGLRCKPSGQINNKEKLETKIDLLRNDIAIIQDLNQSIKKTVSELHELEKTITDLFESILQKIHENSQSKLKAYQEDLERRKIEIAHYKENVEQNKKKQQTEKKNKSNEQQQTKIELAKQAVPETTMSYVNTSMEEKLISLNHSNLQTLTNILTLSGKVYFSELIQLVEALGGKILEHGGSHKTIEIEKYQTLIAVDVNGGIDVNTLSPHVKGGIFKPHGKSHSPGLISGFNLKMAKHVFDQAKITIEKVNELATMKSERPVVG